MRHRKTAAVFSYGLLAAAVAGGGEIAGMPAQTPPFIEPDFELNFSNDFLGRGGSVDDFRTQQIIMAARFAEDWVALLDHSILTLEDAAQQGRLDQLSGSIGYRLIHAAGPDRNSSLLVGGGFRSNGEFAGERMQNGFHQLIGSDVVTLPYVDTERTDATVWVDGQHYRLLRPAGGSGLFAGWAGGYWIRGNSLLTGDGQWDSSLGAYAIASRDAVDVWLGLRHDWRLGYDRDPVQAATAAAEQDLAVVLGVRFGALLLETVQQTRNEASYGQLRLISSGRREFPAASVWPRAQIEFGIVLPDVHLQLAGKFRSHVFTGSESRWREAVLIETKFGEPQLMSDSSLFVRSRQLTVGLEWERPWSASLPWISAYGALSGGWRSEQLLGDNERDGQTSESVSRGVINGGAGLRFHAAGPGRGWWYRLQLGLVAWVPLNDATVVLDAESFRIQQSALGISLGMTFEYE